MIERLFCAHQELNDEAINAVIQKQYEFNSPEDSLGRIAEIVVKLASHQKTINPQVKKPWLSVFVADHGIAVEGVSDFSQEMTAKWSESICKGEAAISGLASFSKLEVDVVDVGLIGNLSSNDSLSVSKIGQGTQNFSKKPAMSQEEMLRAIEVGMQTAEKAKTAGSDLFIAGELGVANTTSAIAMVSVLSGKTPIELMEIGRTRVMRSERDKAELIEKAIDLHKEKLTSPLRILQHLGGFETAALCGAYIRAAQLGMTIIVDGFMSTVAVWLADLVSRNDQLMHCKSVDMMMDLGQFSVPETMFCICGTCPRLVEWCFFSHKSAVNIHGLVLEILAVDPMLTFDMKLGQGTGAVMVLPLLEQACAVHNHLAQFVMGEGILGGSDEPKDNCPFY
ncbi:nicotinate-nucleotide--dimethylbenzimidazole phosphoribosyltransferase [Thiomicrorhabdus lithotrophica]|uniref:Nicotinate-nucleotide--dimethylbenzimidazole phosphoribosyltransferase n=1 Tax=Thiomicrorhabdus lithotrophica TaxID=2949997 RepID=A0ABY8C777_9GAMM|nr:nicotinate-nucleotide--dimethylbenzimidazole phosphoribosyltransferase [Thiomicrorhabdus lithotrophica]WEJ61759.1 nicotinate-nucleotide--dimethylbenzimidazole phosphoribosyltransferase [Thiomicrorhabdus lithotrophica]